MSIAERNQMRKADWTSLVYSVERGTCILLLGPDAVHGTIDGEYLPVHVALARYVRDRLGPQFAHLDPERPSSVARAAVAHEDQYTLLGWVEEFYDEFEGDFEMLRDLASLPFQLIINSSPGLSAQQVFQEVKPHTSSDFYDRTGPRRGPLPDASVDAPIVYHLYGSLEQPSSLILTDRDRLDFIVSVVSDEPPLPPKLKSALADPNRTFLFLGFDLTQWQFRVFLHVLAGGSRQNKSFAFEPDPDVIDADALEFFRADHKIHFVSGDLTAFAHELRARVNLEPHAGDIERSDDGVPPGAPIAFVCHASEDKAFAERIASHLQANGIEAWFDRDDLAGGDQWDDKIRRAIRDEVNYVVVLQSASLLAKDEGYVNREIKLALDRQDEFRSDRRFLLPVIVDDATNRLRELSHIQSTDLSSPDGFDSLVKTIKRDQKQARTAL